ncbi:MAG: multiple antibiotic resistance protein [Paracoccaceae bacterium]|jgi:multiple antibiotic resistance protein
MVELITTTFVTLFVIIDPIAVAPIFAALTEGSSNSERRAMAIKAVIVAAVTLVIFALVGEVFLKSMGITLPAFRIAGGVLLFILAIEMVFAHQSGIRTTTTGEKQEAIRKKDVSVFPLGIPLIAGPGAMASVILLIGEHPGDLTGQALIIVVLLVVLALSLAMLLVAGQIVKYLGVTGVNVVGRVFGIVLGALAVQYILDGIRQSFHALT